MSIKVGKKVCVFKACITCTIIINQKCNIISFLFEYLIQKTNIVLLCVFLELQLTKE